MSKPYKETPIRESVHYSGPLGPFQLYTADFEFLNFSLRNLTFLPSNFLPSYFSLRNFTFLPSNFPLQNFTFLPSNFTLFSLPYKTSLLNLRWVKAQS